LAKKSPSLRDVWNKLVEHDGRFDVLEARIEGVQKRVEDLIKRVEELDRRVWYILAAISLSILVTIMRGWLL